MQKSPFDLSGGQKRRVAIAGVLSMEPSALVLDEPVAGLDPKGRERMLSMLKNLRVQRNNMTIILVSHSMEDIAGKLGAPVVPYMGQFTIDEAIEFVKKGFKSTIAENKDYDAEGLVLKSPNGLCTRRGERIIFKVKTCDFIKYKNKYGNNDKS